MRPLVLSVLLALALVVEWTVMPYTTEIARRYKHHVTIPNVRRVWSAVTETPCAPTRQLGERLGLSYSYCAAALRLLRDAGYIEFELGSFGGRKVVVPFIVTEDRS